MTAAKKRRPITLDERRIAHIFRVAEGHMPIDTPETRQILIDVANSPAGLLGVDRFGTRWAASNLPDGRQLWVQMRGDRISNGGINHRPRDFVHGLGLSKPLRGRGTS